MRQHDTFWRQGIAGFMIAISGGLVGLNFSEWSRGHRYLLASNEFIQGCAWILNCSLWFSILRLRRANG